MVTWHQTMKLFLAKCHERATFRKLSSNITCKMLTAVARDQRWPDVVAGNSARFSNLLLFWDQSLSVKLLILDADFFCRHQISVNLPPLRKNFTLKNFILQSLLWNKCDWAEVLTWQAWQIKAILLFTKCLYGWQFWRFLLVDEKQCEHDCRGREATAPHSVWLSHEPKRTQNKRQQEN